MANLIADLADRQVRLLPLEALDISDVNVRRREITAELDELAKSLDQHGLYQPIVVAPNSGRFVIVIGQRRYLAAKQLGWDQIPALVLSQFPERVQATLLSFSENIQRRDLSARDKSDACSFLLRELGTVNAVAEAVGITARTVRKWLGYAAVQDPIKELVQEGGLTVPQALRITEHVDDLETAFAVANQLARTPIKADRDRVLESVAELPGRSAETIFRRAEAKRNQKRITFILTESSAEAIDEAAREQSTDANDIAMSATIQWLEDNKYLT